MLARSVLIAIACGTIAAASPLSYSRRQAAASASVAANPESDPFYHPTGYQSKAPGDIIDSRTVTTTVGKNLAAYGFSISSYQISYRTTGPRGEPLSAVTTLFVPSTKRVVDTLVAYNVPEDSSFIDCAPSYSFRADANATKVNPLNIGEAAIFQTLLARGYAISSADYESNEYSAFSVGALAGHGVLDGIRAALNYKTTGLSGSAAGTKVAIMGYSGGAIATGWAVSLAPMYAPELNIVAGAFGGTPANITATNLFLQNTLYSGFTVGGLAGFVQAYSDLIKDYLYSVATPAGLAAVYYGSRFCASNDLTKYPLVDFLSTNYTTLGAGLLTAPPIAAILQNQTMGAGPYQSAVPKAPLYVVHCQTDQIIPIGPANTLVDTWCNAGVKIKYERDVSGTCRHETELALAFPSLLAFVEGRFNGSVSLSSCSTTNVSRPATTGAARLR